MALPLTFFLFKRAYVKRFAKISCLHRRYIYHYWDEWKVYFESKGYKCIAPAWPHKEASPEELRNTRPNDAIASNRLADLTDHFASIVLEIPEKPILIGHSLGGLIVQLLLQRGLGTAGVALHAFPPKGVTGSTFSLVKKLWEARGLFTSTQETYMIPFRKWKQAFANGMSCEEQKALFYKYAIPESKRVIRDAFKSTAKIDFEKPHAPLLLTSGINDQMIPASLNYNNYLHYTLSITDYKEFKNSNHLVFDHPLEEAEYVFHWLQEIQEFYQH